MKDSQKLKEMEEEAMTEEINKLVKEEAKKDIGNLREDLSVLFEQQDKTMKNPRKLSYSQHWMEHWREKIAKQYLFFFNLGEELKKGAEDEN